MGPTERFLELVEMEHPPLDELALLVAAHAYPDLDVGAQLTRLDALAGDVREPTLDGLTRALFDQGGFSGNRLDYYDPRNSYLNDVLDRRRGIPITLAVVALEVGRRVGVPLSGVSMPGHFLLRDKVDPGLFLDPFARGQRFDADGARRRFHEVAGADAPFDERFLDPVGPVSLVTRMLTNLRLIHLHRQDTDSLLWVLTLRSHLPEVPWPERRELSALLAMKGRWSEAAGLLEATADAVGGDEAEALRQEAGRVRARSN